MPYRLKPNNKRIVQVFKNGYWWDYKTYSTVEAAKRALARLKRKGHG